MISTTVAPFRMALSRVRLTGIPDAPRPRFARFCEAKRNQRSEQLTAANSRLEAEIAQRKAAEDQLYQAQKTEALGQLTGGIAHDLNNLLALRFVGTARASHLARKESASIAERARRDVAWGKADRVTARLRAQATSQARFGRHQLYRDRGNRSPASLYRRHRRGSPYSRERAMAGSSRMGEGTTVQIYPPRASAAR